MRYALDRLFAQLLLAAQENDAAQAQALLETTWLVPEGYLVPVNAESAPLYSHFYRLIFSARFLERFEHLVSLCDLPPDELLGWQNRFLAEADAAEPMLLLAAASTRANFQRWTLEMADRPEYFRKLVKEQYGQPKTPKWKLKVQALDKLMTDWLNQPPVRPMPAEFAGYLRYQTDVLAILRKPIPMEDRWTELKALHAAIDERPLYTRLMRIAYDKSLDVMLRCQAELRALALLLACERYRLQHGRWPETAAALTPQFLKQLPLDPYTDKPMAFE